MQRKCALPSGPVGVRNAAWLAIYSPGDRLLLAVAASISGDRCLRSQTQLLFRRPEMGGSERVSSEYF